MGRVNISNTVDETVWKSFKKAVIDANKKINGVLDEALKEWSAKKKK